MQVIYELTADDYRHALIAYRNRNFLSRWLMPFFALFFTLWAAIQLMSNSPAMRWSFVLIGAGIGVSLFIHWGAPYLNARRQFRNTPSARGQITLDLQDGGLHFRSTNTDGSVSWQHYIKWIEDERVFVLFSSPLIFVLVPKRAFDPGQLALFKDTLRQKILA
jgi:hypothetical protein